MKVSIEDIVQSQAKTGNKERVRKMLKKMFVVPDDVKDEETFNLSPTGCEIHNGESMVDRLTPVESLREKIARFDRLAEQVMSNRAYMMRMAQEMAGDDEDPDDFGFEDGDDYDQFGDLIESPIGEEPAGQARAPQKAGAPEKQGDEPVDDVSDLSTESDPE